jgi:cell division protein FtsB
MESFDTLEKKVVQLIELTRALKSENAALAKDNTELKKKVTTLQADADKSVEATALEKEKAKLFMTDIIKNIDQLVENNG